MPKEINRVSFEIEHYNGDTYMSFMLSIKKDGTVEVINETDCSLADVENDYIYNTDNTLYRIQADDPIDEDTYEENWECYNKHEGTPCDYGDCPYNAEGGYDCRNYCGLGVDEDEYYDEEYTPSAENGDYGPSNPWDAPGCQISDYISGVIY